VSGRELAQGSGDNRQIIRILAEVDVVGGLSYLDPNPAKPPKEK
jgi:hypothetical protein